MDDILSDVLYKKWSKSSKTYITRLLLLARWHAIVEK